jgi:hypothetical protein
MFPLSTPTNTGVSIDLLSLAIVLAGMAAFAAGLADAWARLRAKSGRATLPDLDPVTLAAYAALGLVALVVAVMLAGARGIPVAQAVFLAVAFWGLATATRRAPRAWKWPQCASSADLSRAALFAAAACWSVWFWAGVFQDHVGLSVAHDGIAHTAWYLRILESGVPTLGRVPIGFREVFGEQMVEFYPTGTHALVAISSGFWGQWGVISHAGILKAWFTLAMAAAGGTLPRRVLPDAPDGVRDAGRAACVRRRLRGGRHGARSRLAPACFETGGPGRRRHDRRPDRGGIASMESRRGSAADDRGFLMDRGVVPAAARLGHAVRPGLRHGSDQAVAGRRIDRFRRPGYFLVATPAASTRTFPVCADATYMTTLDDRAIFSYRNPVLGP